MNTNILILHGNEPYCIDYYKNRVVKGISSENIRLFYGDFSSEVIEAAYTYPFLADKKAVILDMDSINMLDTPYFKKYEEAPCSTTIFIGIIRNLSKKDQQKKIYKELSKRGVIKVCNKITNTKTLRTILQNEAATSGATFTEDGYSEFMKLVNYQNMEEVTLLQIIQILHSFATFEKTLTKEVISKYVKPLREPNIFGLSSMILFKNIEGLKQEAALLSEEEPIKILSLLLREYRIAYKLKAGLEKSEIGVNRVTLSVLSKEEALYGIQFLNSMIQKLKRNEYPKMLAIEYACMHLMGNRTGSKEEIRRK